MTSNRTAGDVRRQQAGHVPQLLIDQIVANGFGVQTQEWEDISTLTFVGVNEARSCLTVTPEWSVRWDYQPNSGPQSSPAALTGIVLHLFGADAQNIPADGTIYRNFELKGVVGRLLQDRGLKVDLLTYEDLESFDVIGEISATDPGRPELGTVRVTDHCDVEWDFDGEQAFNSDPAAIVALVAPILRRPIGTRPPRETR